VTKVLSWALSESETPKLKEMSNREIVFNI
jgi:hypothetical protein